MGFVPQGVSSRNFFFQEAIFIMTCQGGNSAKVKIIEIPKRSQGLVNVKTDAL